MTDRTARNVEILDTCLHVALEAVSRRLREAVWHLNDSTVLDKRSDGDLTRRFDLISEETLLRELERTGIPLVVYSEESGRIDLGENAEFAVIMDPVDGSHLAARGYMLCSSAVTVVSLQTGQPLLSRIVDVGSGGQFVARGRAAGHSFLPVQRSTVTKLRDAFAVSYMATPSRTTSGQSPLPLLSHCSLWLNYGGPLDIARIATGQVDLFVESDKGFAARDLFPGLHIATSSGAVAASLDGGEFRFRGDTSAKWRFVVAATQELLDEALRLL